MDERLIRRARVVERRVARAERTLHLWRMERDALVVRLTDDGLSQRKVARLVGLTGPRVDQILKRSGLHRQEHHGGDLPA